MREKFDYLCEHPEELDGKLIEFYYCGSSEHSSLVVPENVKFDYEEEGVYFYRVKYSYMFNGESDELGFLKDRECLVMVSENDEDSYVYIHNCNSDEIKRVFEYLMDENEPLKFFKGGKNTLHVAYIEDGEIREFCHINRKIHYDMMYEPALYKLKIASDETVDKVLKEKKLTVDGLFKDFEKSKHRWFENDEEEYI